MNLRKQRPRARYYIRRFEKHILSLGFKKICGIDEAGRGALAGPVVVGAVILPPDCKLRGIKDSKQLTPKEREDFYNEILSVAEAVGIGYAPVEIIEKLNVLEATYFAMWEAIKQLKIVPDFLLLDAVKLKNCPIPQKSIIDGDCKSISIAAASIIAKVTRDRWMIEQDKYYPQYGFAQHKGYGTKQHLEAIKKYGLCPLHRPSFIHV